MDGREALQAHQADPTLLDIPVVVLTTSSLDEDVIRSYRSA
jgi:two-component system response regulator